MNRTERLRDPAILVSLAAPALGGLYLLLTSTTLLIPDIWPYDAKRILQFTLLVIFFCLPLISPEVRAEYGSQLKTIPRWIQVSLLIIFGFGLMSVAVNAQSVMHGLNSASEVVLLSLLVLAIILLAACRRIAGELFDRIVVGSLAVTGLTVGSQELMGVLAAHAGGADFTFRVSLLYFSWPRFYNQVQAWMLLPLTGLVILFPRNHLAQIIALLSISLQWYIILMTGARGLFVSVVSGLLFALLFLPAIRKHVFLWQAAGLILGLVVYTIVLISFKPAAEEAVTDVKGQTQEQLVAPKEGLYGNQENTTSGFYAQSLGRPMLNSSGRIRDWETSLNLAIGNPWLGIGPNNYVCTASVGMSHPHNFPLQLAVEWGIPASLIACFLVLILLKSAVFAGRIRKHEETSNHLLFNLLLAGAVTGLVYSTLSGVFVMPASQTTGLLVCGTLLGLARTHQISPPSENRIRAVVAIPILSLGLLILGAYELSTMKERSALLTPEYNMYPRIWQDAMVCRFYTQP